MSDDQSRPESGEPEAGQPAGGPGPESQEIRFSQISALVPEGVSPGVFSTGAVVLTGPHEFIIDFLLRMTKPHQVAARVVMPPPVVARLILALLENLKNYKNTFGAPQPSAPAVAETGSSQQRPTTVSNQSTTAQDLYDQLKLPDSLLSGAYANAVMIGHTATEFSFDFITTFFPRSAVACRVYLAAPNARRFLDSLTHSYEQYQRKLRSQMPDQPSETPPAAE